MMKIRNGIEFNILNAEEITRFNGYDKAVAECHIANFGKIIVDAVYQQPIDNEYDLEEIYNTINA